jgi:hypothetical protein
MSGPLETADHNQRRTRASRFGSLALCRDATDRQNITVVVLEWSGDAGASTQRKASADGQTLMDAVSQGVRRRPLRESHPFDTCLRTSQHGPTIRGFLTSASSVRAILKSSVRLKVWAVCPPAGRTNGAASKPMAAFIAAARRSGISGVGQPIWPPGTRTPDMVRKSLRGQGRVLASGRMTR